MALDSVPWLIGGGAEHSPDVARAMLYAAAGGQEGVTDPESFRVTTTPTPGTSVRVSTGVAIVNNRSSAGARQAYGCRAGSSTDVPVRATGSGGARSDLLVVRVRDHQYSPWQSPANLQLGPYVEFFIVENVAPGTKTVAQVGLTYSALALARIDLPANTATVQSYMIQNLRTLTQPRAHRETNTNQGRTTSTLTSESWVAWPPYNPTVLVPQWATHAQIKATLSGVRAVGPVDGEMAVNLNSLGGTQVVAGAIQKYDVDVPIAVYGTSAETATGGGAARFTIVLTAYGDVRNYQGQEMQQQCAAHKLAGRADRGNINVDEFATVTFEIDFYERTV